MSISAAENRTLVVQDSQLIPAGVYRAVCQGIKVHEEFWRFLFHLKGGGNDGRLVDGLTESELYDDSRATHWIRTLSERDLLAGESVGLADIDRDISGSECFVEVVHREGENRTFANVSRVYAKDDPKFVTSSNDV